MPKSRIERMVAAGAVSMAIERPAQLEWYLTRLERRALARSRRQALQSSHEKADPCPSQQALAPRNCRYCFATIAGDRVDDFCSEECDDAYWQIVPVLE